MITKDNAIAIGKAIIKARTKETDNYEVYHNTIEGVRACAYVALNELWYTVFDNKLKEKFDYNFAIYYSVVQN